MDLHFKGSVLVIPLQIKFIGPKFDQLIYLQNLIKFIFLSELMDKYHHHPTISPTLTIVSTRCFSIQSSAMAFAITSTSFATAKPT